MRSGRALRRKKTNLATVLKGAVTMYAPGNFPVPYGANGLMIGGRGASGNSPVGGNYKSGGNLSYNPTYKWGGSYTDYYDTTNGWHVYATDDDPWGPSISQPSPYTYYANGNYPGPSRVTYNLHGTDPGTAYYNPTNYNPYNPGNTGPTANIGGVIFSGGVADGGLAPVVAPTLSNLKYTQSALAVTVPVGGYVTFTPID